MPNHVCPWWLGYFLANPLRKLIHNPERILAPYLKKGMQMLDIGPGMGFFSIPAAKLLGEAGRIYGVDLQPKMLDALARRAAKAGVAGRVVPRLANPDSLAIPDLRETIDFGLAFAVVHEVVDQPRFFAEIYQALKPGGLLLVAEPRQHVGARKFEAEIDIAQKTGFAIETRPRITQSHAVVLRKR
jgi:ubiquinone/menaquinone biosynthesis C-methylase UbiE